jgi:hypothetical protein
MLSDDEHPEYVWPPCWIQERRADPLYRTMMARFQKYQDAETRYYYDDSSDNLIAADNLYATFERAYEEYYRTPAGASWLPYPSRWKHLNWLQALAEGQPDLYWQYLRECRQWPPTSDDPGERPWSSCRQR